MAWHSIPTFFLFLCFGNPLFQRRPYSFQKWRCSNSICAIGNVLNLDTIEPPWLYVASRTTVHLDVKLYEVIKVNCTFLLTTTKLRLLLCLTVNDIFSHPILCMIQNSNLPFSYTLIHFATWLHLYQIKHECKMRHEEQLNMGLFIFNSTCCRRRYYVLCYMVTLAKILARRGLCRVKFLVLV
jgi:hypothetical protein